MDKFTTFWCNVSPGHRIPNIIEIGPRLTSYSKKQKGGSFWDTVYNFNYLRQSIEVCFHFCWFVCLSTTLLKKLWTDFYYILWVDGPGAGMLIRFCDESGSGPDQFFQPAERF